jgi:hypothetical protein
VAEPVNGSTSKTFRHLVCRLMIVYDMRAQDEGALIRRGGGVSTAASGPTERYTQTEYT